MGLFVGNDMVPTWGIKNYHQSKKISFNEISFT